MIQRQEKPELRPGEGSYSWEATARLPEVAPTADAAIQLPNLPRARETVAKTPQIKSIPLVKQVEETIAQEHHLARIAQLRSTAAKLREGRLEELNRKITKARIEQASEKVEGIDYALGALTGAIPGLIGAMATGALLESVYGRDFGPMGILVLPAMVILVPACQKIWAVLDKHRRMDRAAAECVKSLGPGEQRAWRDYQNLSEIAAETAKQRGYSDEEKSRLLQAYLLDHAAELEKQADQLEAPPVATGNLSD